MNELMIHVERIVRPVSAMQSRKLRMRRELLAHLQAAVDEERSHGLDDATSLKQATERLGDPVELTRQLQRTVPWFERIMLARFPVSPKVDQWEAKGARMIYGVKAITLLHISILSSLAGLLCVLPYMNAPLRAALTHSGIPPANPTAFFFSLLVFGQLLFLFSCRLVVAAADPQKPLDLPRTLRRAGIVLFLQIAFTFAAPVTAMSRLPTAAELIANIGATTPLLVISIVIARRVATLRRPYDEWLALDLAESN